MTTGKSIGGNARAASLSPEQRTEIARKAANAKKEIALLPKATHGSPDHPLKIGEIEITCYVLNDGTRVLSQRGMIAGLGMKRGSNPISGGDRLGILLAAKTIAPFVSAELQAAIENPIRFTHPGGGGAAFGYPATILADICDVLLEARKAGKIHQRQEHIVQQAEILVRGFARVGIIALVDEATGYQKDRAKDALAAILEAFVAKELQPYVRTFPPEYYEQLFRLRNLPYPPVNAKYRPQYFGVLTNDIVYKRLAPGLLDELKKQNIKSEKKGKLFQRLTPDAGHPKLREHLASTVTIMKLSSDYPDFISKMNKIHPRYGDNLILDLDIDDQ